MFRILVEKELKAILQSPKFIWTFLTCTILILLSVFIGIKEYKANVSQYETAVQLNEQSMLQSKSWQGLSTKIYRKPDPMQIFVSGVHNDIGRFSGISSWNEVKLKSSIYSNDPIYAVFRFVDFSYIVLIVLTLFAILFTYNSINGERESGTLKLIFANAIPRAKFILAKFLGSFLGLAIPLLIPLLLSVLLVMLFGIPFTAANWLKLIILFVSAILLFTFFMGFGIFISSAVKHSSISFLLLLMFWIVFILIIPRLGIIIAGQIVDVPTIAQMESIADSYQRQRWDKLYKEDMKPVWEKRSKATKGMSDDERTDYYAKNRAIFQEEDDQYRKVVEKEITDYKKKLAEEVKNKRTAQEKLALTLTHFSPASAFLLASMNLAGTNIDLKPRYEESMDAYKQVYLDFTKKKQKETGDQGNFMSISLDSKKGIKVTTGEGRKNNPLDLKEMPQFNEPVQSFTEAFSKTLIDLGILGVLSILSFVGAYIVFVRTDLR
jgi:ABC-type transport system involved in multi-copper enzyme maturation permease subunit